jgi:hypothetical protein
MRTPQAGTLARCQALIPCVLCPTRDGPYGSRCAGGSRACDAPCRLRGRRKCFSRQVEAFRRGDTAGSSGPTAADIVAVADGVTDADALSDAQPSQPFSVIYPAGAFPATCTAPAARGVVG